MKTPYEQEHRNRYNWRKAVRLIQKTISDYQLRNYCFVSSFDHEALKEMELVSRAELNPVRTIYLTNFYTHVEVPPVEQAI